MGIERADSIVVGQDSMGFLVALGGQAPLGLGLTVVVFDALLLLAGATGVVGLWHRGSR